MDCITNFYPVFFINNSELIKECSKNEESYGLVIMISHSTKDIFSEVESIVIEKKKDETYFHGYKTGEYISTFSGKDMYVDISPIFKGFGQADTERQRMMISHAKKKMEIEALSRSTLGTDKIKVSLALEEYSHKDHRENVPGVRISSHIKEAFIIKR